MKKIFVFVFRVGADRFPAPPRRLPNLNAATGANNVSEGNFFSLPGSRLSIIAFFFYTNHCTQAVLPLAS